MISANAVGLVFANAHEMGVPELVARRTMGSVPFGGRYHLIDFCLSGMADAGIRDVAVITRKNYQSLMDHLGNGREWDLSRKRGGLIIFPPYAREGREPYVNRIESISTVLDYLTYQKEELVVISDCNIAFNMDFRELLDSHRAAKADITVVYERNHIEGTMLKDNVVIMQDDEGFVSGLRVNDFVKGERKLSMNIFVVGRELLINLVRESVVQGIKGFETEYLVTNLKKLRVYGYEYTGYRARIHDMQSYFFENLRLIDPKNLAALFPKERMIYTKVRDEAPVRYAIGSRTSRCLVAVGSIIEGDIENCVLFRGVRVGK
ncbi:MAG: glucose-1-phosphate adenylyltransferase subunit GlgD, partial [Oscillospiraceae bacterium]